ncbi:MAG: UdgX family uracil-DNA binding protein [Acidimicrobiales bacterium]
MAASSRLRRLADEAAGCRACPLWRDATQVVFGEGPVSARLIAVGEQPGDQEDRQGHPFVGPAGRVLDDAFDAAGIERSAVYVTNAVKHFKWQARGKRRIHDKPNRTEVVACHQWLDAELAVLRDDAVVVALGATAGQSLLGPAFRVGRARGADLALGPHPLVATIHPSAVLRGPKEDRAERFDGLVADLRRASVLLPA